MPILPTQLTLTPSFDGTKKMAASGTIAVNERVALIVIGAAEIITGTVVRLVSTCGRVEYARFPSESTDAWAVSGTNLTCTLNLNTANLRGVFRCRSSTVTCEADVLLENGVNDNLYGTARLVIRNWVQNPLDPVAGATQIQTQIDNLTARIAEHQHDGEVEGETAFPHNNLLGRSDTGCHPAIESQISDVALVAQGAANAAAVAGDNATVALEAVQALATRVEALETWRALFAALAMFDPETATDFEMRTQVQTITNKLRTP